MCYKQIRSVVVTTSKAPQVELFVTTVKLTPVEVECSALTTAEVTVKKLLAAHEGTREHF